MFTANSMNCMTEVIASETALFPLFMQPVYMQRSRHEGNGALEKISVLAILLPLIIHNALTADMALGCSTNTVLHLPAIAHEAGLKSTLTK